MLWLAFLVITLSATCGVDTSCAYTSPSGYIWDLSLLALQYPPSSPATLNFNYQGFVIYTWSPCAILPQASCAGVDVLPNAAACQIADGNHNIGLGPTPRWTEGN